MTWDSSGIRDNTLLFGGRMQITEKKKAYLGVCTHNKYKKDVEGSAERDT